MSRGTIFALFATLGGLAVTSYAGRASAETQYVAVVIDRTGSMLQLDPSEPTTITYFQKAQNAAMSIIGKYPAPQAGDARAFAVFTFGFDQLGEEPARTNNFHRVYPALGTGCMELNTAGDPSTTPLGVLDTEGNANFCLLSDADETVNTVLLSKLNNNVIKRITPPPSDYVLTPLGDGLCKSMQYLRYNTSAVWKDIILESDGGENHSDTALCGGPASAINADKTHFPDWDLIPDSWQSLAARRGQWLDRDVKADVPADSILGWNNPFAENRWITPSADAPLVKLNWRVGALFSFTESSLAPSSLAAPVDPSAPITDLAMTRLMREGEDSFSSASSFALAVPSMAESEFVFFHELGTSTPHSTFTEIAYEPGTVYGKDHAVAGDVDDNGCTDQADLSTLLSKDVFWQQAVEPNATAIAADLTRDGWVNMDDRDYLLPHWGTGCVNPVPPPQYTGSPWETCSETTATDMGSDGNNVTVNNNGCLMVRNGYPCWWGTRSMALQNPSAGTYPVTFSWYNMCTRGWGTGTFTGDWQKQYLPSTNSGCATLIRLQGQGDAQITLRYYAGNQQGECGDGTINDGEECDDGNAAGGDGCSQTCQWEDCSSGVRDGVEADVDCGGRCALGCVANQHCNVNEDCRSNICTNNACVAASPATCTVATAVDLGGPGNAMTVGNDACLKVQNYPTWWGTRAMSLQDMAPGSYPVPFSWWNVCSGSSGADTFTGNWQSKTLSTTSRACPTLIWLQGSGSGNVKLRYHAAQ